jgi:magnesium-transporting ATPase (P-type)
MIVLRGTSYVFSLLSLHLVSHHRPYTGINDGPALACADVGVSMGEGAALAMEMSDVTLMDSNLSKLVYIIQMGSRVLLTIRENILLSLFCKLAVVSLTFAGSMTLFYAIASDVGVMLLVTLNGMKLLPSTRESVELSPKRLHAWKRYAGVPLTSPPNQTGYDNEVV